MCVNNLSEVALDSAAAGIEPATSSRKSIALTTAPPSLTTAHMHTLHFIGLCFVYQVNCVALSADFEMMVTGSDDYKLCIFNTLSGKLVATLEGHTGLWHTSCNFFVCICLSVIISVSIPGRVFLFPGIREWQFSFPGFPGMMNIMRDWWQKIY